MFPPYPGPVGCHFLHMKALCVQHSLTLALSDRLLFSKLSLTGFLLPIIHHVGSVLSHLALSSDSRSFVDLSVGKMLLFHDNKHHTNPQRFLLYDPEQTISNSLDVNFSNQEQNNRHYSTKFLSGSTCHSPFKSIISERSYGFYIHFIMIKYIILLGGQEEKTALT